MSKGSARDFLAACDTDAGIEKAVCALPQEGEASFEAIAGLAAGLGYDFSAAELAEVFSERTAGARLVLEGQELSDAELAQVAGGGLRPECSDDFNPNDSCYFDDRCMKAWNYYKKNTACATTYDWVFDRCEFSDRCSTGTNTYLAGEGEWIY